MFGGAPLPASLPLELGQATVLKHLECVAVSPRSGISKLFFSFLFLFSSIEKIAQETFPPMCIGAALWSAASSKARSVSRITLGVFGQ